MNKLIVTPTYGHNLMIDPQDGGIYISGRKVAEKSIREEVKKYSLEPNALNIPVPVLFYNDWLGCRLKNWNAVEIAEQHVMERYKIIGKTVMLVDGFEKSISGLPLYQRREFERLTGKKAVIRRIEPLPTGKEVLTVEYQTIYKTISLYREDFIIID